MQDHEKDRLYLKISYNVSVKKALSSLPAGRQVTVRDIPMPFVYFIKSEKSNWVYVGSTENLGKRISQHNSGEVTATKYRRPYFLIHFEKYDNIQDARDREKNIKRTRSLKEKIIKEALSSNG